MGLFVVTILRLPIKSLTEGRRHEEGKAPKSRGAEGKEDGKTLQTQVRMQGLQRPPAAA